MRRTTQWLALVAGLAAATCQSESPVAGELSVRITTPRTSDRAILFALVGPARAVAAAPGYRVFTDTAALGDTTHVTVVAAPGSGLVAGEIARVAVNDIRRAGSYAAILRDVAAADYSIGDTAGISLKVVTP